MTCDYLLCLTQTRTLRLNVYPISHKHLYSISYIVETNKLTIRRKLKRYLDITCGNVRSEKKGILKLIIQFTIFTKVPRNLRNGLVKNLPLFIKCTNYGES